jgi:predicted lipoprotein with Yx(FWY)xxD motif
MTFRPITTRRHARVRHSLRRPVVFLAACVAGVGMSVFVGLAAARSLTTLSTAKNSTIGKTIVVDSRGLTVYELSPETTHHLLCKKASGCFSAWPPLTVASAKTKLTAARGVTGKLGILHRNGIFQVTLGGHPLYHFAGDGSRKGMANGQGIHSFGGNWHVVAASSTGNTPTTTPTMTTTTTPTPTTTMPTAPYQPPVY